MRLHGISTISKLVVIFGLLGCEEAVDSTSPPAGTANADSSETESAQTLIVAMGDSLTEGLYADADESYPAQLESRLRELGYRVKVINAGISGETSTAALARVDWVLRLQPDVVVLETGANDGLRGLDPQLTQENIDQLVARLRAAEVQVVLAGMQIVQNMGQPYVDQFRSIYPAVAKKHKVELVPFFLAGVAGKPSLNHADGIHPNAEGYAVVVDQLVPHLVRVLGPPVTE